MDLSDPAFRPPALGEAPSRGGRWWSSIFRSLQHKDFRLLWVGQALQSEGQWMEQVARGWLLWELSHDPFVLGLYGAVRSLPSIVLSLPAGVLADRISRVKLLQASQVSACLLAFLFGGLVQAGLITVPLIMLFAFANGTAETMRRPASQALISNLVPSRDIMNAVAINEVAQYTMRILGPVLAGALIGPYGVAAVFYLRGALYLVAVITSGLIKLPGGAPRPRDRTMWQHMGETFRYLAANRIILTAVLLGVVQGVIGQPYQYLMPIFAADIFQVSALGLGILTASAGVGALVGALMLAGLGNVRRVGLLVLSALLGYGGCMIAFSFSPSFEIALVLLLAVGASQSVFLAMRQVMVQLLVSDDLRGRVFSVTHLTRGTLSPVGAYLAGVLATLGSAQIAVSVMGGAILLVGVGCASLLPRVRRLEYDDLGEGVATSRH